MPQPTVPVGAPTAVDDVIITDQLASRPSRPAEWQAESLALGKLLEAMAESPQTVLQQLVDTALELCHAQSAGISIEEGSVFRWQATTGMLGGYVGGTMPRDFSPCGTVLDRDCALLMSNPVRFFPYIAELSAPVREVLLVPFYQQGVAVGTVWVVAHTPERRFDAEDARLVGSLARFAGAAVQMLNRIDEGSRTESALRELAGRLEHQSRVFDTTLSSIPDFAYSFGRDGRFVYANQPLLDLLGMKLEEVVGKNFFELEYPDDLAAQLQRQIQQVFETGEGLTDETPYISQTGAGGYYEYIFRPVFDLTGQVELVVGSTRDITARRNAEDALRSAQSRLEATLAAGEVATWTWDLRADRVTADRNLAYLFGVSPENAAGGKISAYLAAIHDDDRESATAAIRRAILDQAPFEASYRVRNATGEYRSVIARGKAEYDENGQAVGLPGVIVDITQQKRAEAEREHLVEVLRDADRRKDDFIALLAHELRNPLAPIRNGLQVLRMAGGDESTALQARSMMERQLSHMVRLIDDLLDISRISRNKMELRRSRVALAEVLSSAVETARPAIEEAGHELTVSLAAGPVFLDADLTRLSQVFGNLLTNSAKYTPRGGRIGVSVECRSGAVAVLVRDTGIGIPAESLKDIFNMFSQVDRSVERSTGGLGIGLALVRGLVEMHGGTVSAASEGPGKGSTMTVVLPLIVEAEELSPAASAPHAQVEAESKLRILVVDDNRDGAQSLAMMLRLLGNDVRTANDGVEALAEAEYFRPEIILMDVGMPKLNGYEATKRIRQQPWGKRVTIIALTGWGQEGDKERSSDAGCDGHLVKPVNLPDLDKLLLGRSRR